MAKTLNEIVSAVGACGDGLRTCMVDAVLIDDKNQRIDKALKCIGEYHACYDKAVSDVARQKEIDRLKKKLLAHLTKSRK